jgi:hypothetical protein
VIEEVLREMEKGDEKPGESYGKGSVCRRLQATEGVGGKDN